MSTEQSDIRPPVWVGHVSMGTAKIAESQTFMEQLGMRPMFRNESVAIFELRGGTHLVLRHKDTMTPGDSSFDLMVDDIEETHAEFLGKGLGPSKIEEGRIHQSFFLKDPAGNTIKFNSTHVGDLPV